MIDLSKVNIEIPDGMTVDEMRARMVELVDVMKASNQDETEIYVKNKELSDENDRLRKQNLDLFNRVTMPIIINKHTETDDSSPTTDEIISYYSK